MKATYKIGNEEVHENLKDSIKPEYRELFFEVEVPGVEIDPKRKMLPHSNRPEPSIRKSTNVSERPKYEDISYGSVFTLKKIIKAFQENKVSMAPHASPKTFSIMQMMRSSTPLVISNVIFIIKPFDPAHYDYSKIGFIICGTQEDTTYYIQAHINNAIGDSATVLIDNILDYTELLDMRNSLNAFDAKTKKRFTNTRHAINQVRPKNWEVIV